MGNGVATVRGRKVASEKGGRPPFTGLQAALDGKQASDATLTSLTALGTAADKIAYTTGVDTWAEAALTAAGRALLDDADNTTQRSTLGLAIGTDVQAYNARLADLAGAAWAQGDIVYHNGTNLVRLAAGTSGQFLKTQGAAANPIWADVSSGVWVEIGHTTVGSAVASVETTFTAGTYSQILVVISGLSSASTNITLNVTLRHSGGVGATKRHVGHLVAYYIAGTDHLVAQGSNPTAPDRVRVAFSSGNIDDGHVIVYGLTAEGRRHRTPWPCAPPATRSPVVRPSLSRDSPADTGAWNSIPADLS